MRVLHTSDWHLGKKIYRESRLEEQADFLKWLLAEIEDQSIDVLIIAGDIFDVPTPPNDAHKLYNDFLNSACKLCHSIIIISGNHDSGDFLKATQTFTEEKNIYIFDKLRPIKKENELKLNINGQVVNFTCLPYFRNIELHQYYQANFEQDKPESWREDSLTHLMQNDYENCKIAISHHAYGNYSATGSEHTLSLAGLDSLSLGIFKDYDYVALGHIHQYQKLSSKPLSFYTGSPIPMRFSESKQKYYNLLDIKNNQINIEKREIPSFREIIQIKTNSENYIEDINLALTDIDSRRMPFIEVKIKMLSTLAGMSETIKDLCEKHSAKLLNIIPILEYIDEENEENKIDIQKLSPLELFEVYYHSKYPNSEVNQSLKSKFNELISEIKNEDS